MSVAENTSEAAGSVLTGAELVAAAGAMRPEIAAQAARRDAERQLPFEALAAMKKAGLLTARIPRHAGGPGASWTQTAHIVRELSRGDPNVGQAIQSQCVLLETFRADAPAAQRRRFFGYVLGGQMITNAIAERGGAFYGDIQATLTRTPTGLRLNGVKYYATGSLFAEHLCITAIDAYGAVANIVVPRRRDGITVLDDWNGMGQRTTASGTVRLDEVAVDENEVFFSPAAADRRWHLQSAAQLLHVAIDAGIALAALDDAIVLCRTKGRPLRESGVSRASDDPYVQQAVGDMAVLAHGASALLDRAAGLVDAAADAFFAGTASDELFVDASIGVAEAKILATQAALGVSEKLFLVANASGTDRALNLDRHWRNARTHTAHDPVAYKAKFIGDYLLNGRLPPTTAKI